MSMSNLEQATTKTIATKTSIRNKIKNMRGVIRSKRMPKGNLMRSNKKSIQQLISEAKHIPDEVYE